MTHYTQLSRKAKQFHALTGYTLEEFHALLAAFLISFLAYVQAYTLQGKKRQKRRYVTYKNSPLPTMEDEPLFILITYARQPPRISLGRFLACRSRWSTSRCMGCNLVSTRL